MSNQIAQFKNEPKIKTIPAIIVGVGEPYETDGKMFIHCKFILAGGTTIEGISFLTKVKKSKTLKLNNYVLLSYDELLSNKTTYEEDGVNYFHSHDFNRFNTYESSVVKTLEVIFNRFS